MLRLKSTVRVRVRVRVRSTIDLPLEPRLQLVEAVGEQLAW